MKILKEIKRYFKAIWNTKHVVTGIIIHCNRCGGMNLRFGETLKEEREGSELEIYPVFCRDCLTTGVIYEIWDKNNNDDKNKEE